ncbi:hypothetical protein AB0P37_34765 [Streptomyces antimycoticus]|uniref:hypothetical protein n=1 Tax=Streptomyces antimycoticus TaxID=68175 RepID=UPI003416EBFD
MSRTADIDFTFQAPVTASLIVRALSESGWSPAEPRGISYAIQDEDGDLDWSSAPPETLGQIIGALDSPEREQQSIGVSVYHPGAETGGLLLLFPGRREASFTPSINRRSHTVAEEMTDLPWYLEQMLAPLFKIGLLGYTAQDMAD